MKTIRETIENYFVFGETYENPRELLNTICARECFFDSERDRLRDDFQGDDWCGYKTGKQLKADFLSNVCDAKSLKALTSILKPQGRNVPKVRFCNDVVGFKPIVPLAMMNVPKAMFNKKSITIKSKIVNVCVDISAFGNVNSNDLREAGKTIFEAIMGLEQKGYRVNLMVYDTAVMDNDIAWRALKVKDSSQPLDVARCAYPFVNPSYMRGIGFAWYQRTRGFKHSGGYGHPVRSPDEKASFEKSVNDKNTIFLYLTDVINHGKEAINEVLSKSPVSAL